MVLISSHTIRLILTASDWKVVLLVELYCTTETVLSCHYNLLVFVSSWFCCRLLLCLLHSRAASRWYRSTVLSIWTCASNKSRLLYCLTANKVLGNYRGITLSIHPSVCPCQRNFSFTDELIQMKLYTVAVYDLRMYMQGG